jgi:hypothetical protein
MAIDHFRKRRVQAELWNKDTKRRVGTVTLAGGKLEFEIPDEGDRQVVERAFQTGEIVSSWA